MAKGRYIAAVIISGIILIVGIILSCILAERGEDKALYSAISYAIAAVVGNLIWAEGAAAAIGRGGFGIIGSVWGWFISLLDNGLGIIILFLFAVPIFSVISAITIGTLTAIVIVSAIMYPINLIRFALDLY